jgi:hypothetical protein
MKTFAMLGIVLFAACPGTKDIKALLDDPGQYDGKTVRIAGDVTQSASVLGYGGYQVNDGTGTLTVVIEGGGSAPRVGAKVGVEGTFRSAFTFAGRTAAVLVEKGHKVQ